MKLLVEEYTQPVIQPKQRLGHEQQFLAEAGAQG